MLPGVFEWMWDPGHVIFMGIVWAVILIFLSGLIYVLGKSFQDSARDPEGIDNSVMRQRRQRS